MITPEIKALTTLLSSPNILIALLNSEEIYEENKMFDMWQKEIFHELPAWSLHQFEGLKSWSGLTQEKGLLTKVLFLLAHHFFTWSPIKGLPVLRWERVLEFQHLLGEIFIDPLWIFSLVFKTEDIRHYPKIRDTIPPDSWKEFFLPPVEKPLLTELKKRGLSEVHRHLNGSALPILLWDKIFTNLNTLIREILKAHKDLNIILPPKISVKKFCIFLLMMPVVKAILFEFLKKRSSSDYEKIYRIKELFLYSIKTENLSLLTATQDYKDWKSKNLQLYPRKNLGKDERIFLKKCFEFFGKTSSKEFESWLHIYLILQNIFLKNLVQCRNLKGFERFDFFSHSPIRDAIEKEIVPRLFQAWSIGGVSLLEVRIAPKDTLIEMYTKLKNLTTSLKKCSKIVYKNYLKNPSVSPEKLRLWNIGVVLHFIKEKDNIKINSNWEIVPCRHFRLRKKLWKQARIISYLLQKYPINLFPESRMICGLDAANNEVLAGPEVFSPVIRWLRYTVWQKEGRHPLRLTYHVGEEFRHILSGIRAIDEAIRFFKMHTGDRLGHVLALGIDPFLYVKRTAKEVFLPRGEWLDNLVWFQHQLKELRNFESLILTLEEEITFLSKDIYGEKLPVEWLWLSWKYLRRETPEKFLLTELPHCWREEAKEKVGDDVYRIWEKYHFDPSTRKKYDEFIVVNVDTKWCEAIRAVQKKLLSEIIQRELVIEVNPSSNLSIGLFSCLKEHSIFRWFPPHREKGKSYPWVVVGSDDPGIFYTELWYEYIFLARAAKELGYTQHEIYSWLEELRKTGFVFSFVPREDKHKWY